MNYFEFVIEDVVNDQLTAIGNTSFGPAAVGDVPGVDSDFQFINDEQTDEPQFCYVGELESIVLTITRSNSTTYISTGEGFVGPRPPRPAGL